MAKLFSFLLIYATLMAIIKADGLSDIFNNLASDLGPLLSLFGDQITRQYLGESIGFLDFFIFAMAPIGVIGTITAVIRVCGSTSLRAFIDKAQEGQGTTEAELCTSTSVDVCELFNKRGITRVLGRPDIIELEQQQTAPQKLQLFTSYLGNSSNECWHRMMSSGSGNAVFNKIGRSNSGNSLDLALKPNLSLNMGIRRQPDWVFYVIALVGFILQAGILVFAGTAVWLLEWNLQEPNSEASRNYAPGIFIAGTIILCLGAWSCVALIGQTTHEQYYRRSPESSDVLYWIQPGPQVIGDQSFGSFAYSDVKSKDRLMMWTSSTKDFDKNFEPVTYIAVSLVLFGLNAWISIAQLGITLIMSILGGILRMKRLDKTNNRLETWQDLELAKKLKINVQDTSVEKDKSQIFEKNFLWYITGQHEKAIPLENVDVRGSGSETLDTSRKDGESTNNSCKSDLSNEWLVAYNDELIQNRTRLSNLSGHFGKSMDAKSYLSWKDERVRVRAKAKVLGAMISQAAVTLLRNQSSKEDIHLRVKTAVSYDDSNGEETIVSINLEPPTGPDRINWGVDSSQLEAILGLWLWSITRREVVSACHGHSEEDNSFDTNMDLWLGSKDLKYDKVSLGMQSYQSYRYSLADHRISPDEESESSGQGTNQPKKEDNESKSYQRVGESERRSKPGFERFCGWNLIYDALSTAPSKKESNNTSKRRRVNVKASCCTLYSMKTLEIRKLDKISVSESGGNLRLENPVISALAKCFTDNGLGTHSDAISCLIPSLRSEIPPYQEKVLSALTPVASNYRRDDEWSSAEVVLSWACELYRWSLAQMQHSVRQEFGARGIEQMASNTVAKRLNGTRNKRQGKYLWPAARNGWDEIVSALLELKPNPNDQADDGRTLVSHRAESGLRQSLRRLMHLNADLDFADKYKLTPLAYAAMNGREDVARLLIETGQVDLMGSGDSVGKTPLWLAVIQGHFDTIAKLLDKGADVNMETYRGRGLLDLAICRDRGLTEEWEYPYIREVIDRYWRGGSKIAGPELSKVRLHPLIWAAWRGHTDVMRLLLEDHPALTPAGDDETREAKKLLAGGLILQPLRNHSDGFFLTVDPRPFPSPGLADIRHIQFHPPYSQAPRLMIGISGLSLGDDLPLCMDWWAHAVSEDGFVLMRRKCEDTTSREPVDSANVTWIEIGAEEQELQVGGVSSARFVDGCIDVTFRNVFKQEPNLVVWLHGLSHVRKDQQTWDVSARPDRITADGFRMMIESLHGYPKSGVHVARLSYPADSMYIPSGSFRVEPSDYNIIKRQAFAKEFGSIPRVFLALSGLGIYGNKGENIEVKALHADVTGFLELV
ncbi:hypothetical protein V8C34DRAFT_324131 [Trichoderma compactum]